MNYPGRPSQPLSKNLNRLLSAAVVSPRFGRILLSDPQAALALGYNGETFQLTQAEIRAVVAVRVGTIRDFAAQLMVTYAHFATDTCINFEEQTSMRRPEYTVQVSASSH